MNKKYIAGILIIIFILIYYLSSFSRISFGDGIGFLLDVEKRNFINEITPLSHYLYLNTAVFFSKYLHLDSILVMKMMSVIPAAISVGLLFILIKNIIKDNWIAIVSSCIFALSFSFWRNASTIEVYGFNAVFVVLFFIFLLKSKEQPTTKNLILTGFILGISFWVHIQNIMLIPAYILLLFQVKSKNNSSKIFTSLLTFSAILGLLFLTNKLEGIPIKNAFITDRGSWINDTFKQSFTDLLKDVLKSILYLIYNFNIFVLLIFAGIKYLYKNKYDLFLLIITAFIFPFTFATFYAVSDNYVFFIPSYILIAVLIGLGLKAFSFKNNLYLKNLKFISFAIVILTPLFYIASLKIAETLKPLQSFNLEKKYKGGLSYYMLPWLHDNIGSIGFTLRDEQTTDNVKQLKEQCLEFIELRKKTQNMNEIKKL